jgi:TolA-binding protein
MHLARKTVALAATTIVAGGCRAPSPPPAAAPLPTQHLQMDPVWFKVGPDGKVVAELTDADSLFEAAQRLFREKRFEAALERYEKLLDHHPSSRYRIAALYNAGLSLEKLDRLDDAANRYRKVADEVPRSRDAVDAHFRLGEVLAKRKRWREVADLFTRLLLREDLKPIDSFEARVRKGVALAEIGEEDDAERTLLRAVRFYEEASRMEPLFDPGLLAQAFFHLGEVARRRMAATPLRLPQAQLEQDLNRKGHLLLAAQSRYLRAVRTAHPEWAPAAGHQLGLVYEGFHADILAAPIPPELTPVEREVYLEELRKKVRPLIRKAVGIYQRNLSLSQRLGAGGPWGDKTRERMQRLERLLRDAEKAAAPATRTVPAGSTSAPASGATPAPPAGATPTSDPPKEKPAPAPEAPPKPAKKPPPRSRAGSS